MWLASLYSFRPIAEYISSRVGAEDVASLILLGAGLLAWPYLGLKGLRMLTTIPGKGADVYESCKRPRPGHVRVMLFRQATGDLFTAAGAFIKNVHCPKGEAALGLLGIDRRGRLRCHGCSRRIHDARLMTESQVVALVKADPKACLLLDRRNLSLS